MLLHTIFWIWLWEKQGKTIVSRWTEVAKMYPNKKAFVMDDRALTFKEVCTTDFFLGFILYGIGTKEDGRLTVS